MIYRQKVPRAPNDADAIELKSDATGGPAIRRALGGGCGRLDRLAAFLGQQGAFPTSKGAYAPGRKLFPPFCLPTKWVNRQCPPTPDTTGGNSGHKPVGTPDTKIKMRGKLRKLAKELSQINKIPSEKMRAFILQLCQGQSLTAAQIEGVVCRNSERVRKSYLTPMVRSGALKTIYPERNSPEQAYIATPPFITRI